MSKMQPPTLAVVRFDSEDVVVASSNQTTSGHQIDSNTNYVTLNSELVESGSGYENYGTTFAYFFWNGDHITSAGERSDEDALNPQYTLSYAWYHNGYWWTEDKTPPFYTPHYPIQ